MSKKGAEMLFLVGIAFLNRAYAISIFGDNIKSVNFAKSAPTFLNQINVPTFASTPHPQLLNQNDPKIDFNDLEVKRLGLEAVVPGAFLLEDVLSREQCEDVISTAESLGGFHSHNVSATVKSKNNHGAMQILVDEEVADALFCRIAPFVSQPTVVNVNGEEEEKWTICGINRQFRIYRYQPGGQEKFEPHIDCGWPGSGLVSTDSSSNDYSIVFDWYDEVKSEDVLSRMTILMYLNDDFTGGSTNFFQPIARSLDGENKMIASIYPKTGSVLLFPQATSDEEREYAKEFWPLHEGAPVDSGRSKYVIRSDLLFLKETRDEKADPEDKYFKFDEDVRQAFLPTSSAYNPLFLEHTAPLYNAVMGVESAGPLLHSFVRFTKVRRIIGGLHCLSKILELI